MVLTSKSMRGKTDRARRSTCPISASLEVVGDRWTLLIVRDLMFAGFRSYKEFLSSDEGIATNILANRLEHLEACGIVTSRPDPTDGRRLLYRLTPKGIDLAPVLLELSLWGVKHEGGVGPRASIRRWEADREGFRAEVHERWMREERGSDPGAGPEARKRRDRA